MVKSFLWEFVLGVEVGMIYDGKGGTERGAFRTLEGGIKHGEISE